MSFPLNKLNRLAVLALAGLSFPPPELVCAFERLDLNIEEIAATGWRAEQLNFSFAWQSPVGAGYHLQIGRLELPQLEQSISGLQIDCRQGEFSDQRISCDQGQVRLNHPLLQQTAISLRFDLNPASGKFTGALSGVAIADGHLDLDLTLEAGDWNLQIRGKRLNPASLAVLLLQDFQPLADWSYRARIDLDAQLQGQAGALLSASWRTAVAGLSFSDAKGTTAGEGLAGRLQGKLSRAPGYWQVNSELTLDKGELLTPACYLNPAAYPLRLESQWVLDESLQMLKIQDARLRQQDLLDLKLQAELKLSDEHPIQMLKLKVQPFQVADIYRELLQPLLQGTPWGRFEMAGQAELSIYQKGATASLDVGLHDFDLDDAKVNGAPRRMGLYGVNGHLYWNRRGEMRPSWLQWQAGHVMERIDIGPARIDFQTAGEHFKLARQIRLPVLDGFLLVDRLDIEALGEAEQKIQFDGLLEPISMGALSEALGWVPLSGKLSGMLPGLTYKKGIFNLEGILLVHIFDGDILIKHLKLQDLFGVYPQLSADIEMHDLDLETLTGTFSFGKITGRLDGHVRGLGLEAWRPVTFDALFYTPQNDKSRRRISQKAVDNISNLGGAGLSGTATRTFLGMFEEFRYHRLGIGCRLRGGICDMVGVGEAKQGYYLMEGSGIPRIDIIGYNKTADWNRLLEQLKQITKSGAPVIQ